MSTAKSESRSLKEHAPKLLVASTPVLLCCFETSPADSMSVRAEIEANPNAKDAMSPTRQFLPPPPAEEDNMLSKVLRSFLAKSWPLPKSNGRTKKFASSTREEEGIL